MRNCTEDFFLSSDGQCCRRCEAGKYKEKDCGHGAETQCKECERGRFMATANHMTQCRVCRTCNINIKQRMVRECTAREDTVCECVTGYYCTDSSCDHCRPVTRCPEGQGVQALASRTNDTLCSVCESGSFSSVWDAHSTCTPHTRCDDIGRELLTPGTTKSDAVCGRFKSCPWELPAGLWVALVLTSALIFTVALLCCRRNRRLQRRGIVSPPEARVAVVLAADEVPLPLPFKELNGLYPEQMYTPSYSCDLPAYKPDDLHLSCDGLDLEDCSVAITPLKASISFFDSPNLNGTSGNFQRTISEPQEDEWCST
ncbi:unnamed protein product [Knipowitschia caucasica]|uniref:TNFR-Cys domain-containing protein n=1 Tax=Knipowitschia caucasica TaxID=637954 RepID=A0AAV2MC32_KNICA